MTPWGPRAPSLGHSTPCYNTVFSSTMQGVLQGSLSSTVFCTKIPRTVQILLVQYSLACSAPKGSEAASQPLGESQDPGTGGQVPHLGLLDNTWKYGAGHVAQICSSKAVILPTIL